MNGFKRYLSNEINIEFKATMYFFAIIFCISVYQLLVHRYDISILVLAEVIATTYIMGYIQVYFLDNFDEADHFTVRAFLYSLICSALYDGISYLGSWFDHNITAAILFYFMMLLCYWCMYLIYKIRRNIDTKNLNDNLAKFKENRNELKGEDEE